MASVNTHSQLCVNQSGCMLYLEECEELCDVHVSYVGVRR